MPTENEKKEGKALERTFAVLPVKPRWADALLAGTKKWELRTKPLPLGVPVALYATAPEKKVVGAAAFSCFWGIHELIAQEKRVLRGWFPENPNRRDYYESLRK